MFEGRQAVLAKVTKPCTRGLTAGTPVYARQLWRVRSCDCEVLNILPPLHDPPKGHHSTTHGRAPARGRGGVGARERACPHTYLKEQGEWRNQGTPNWLIKTPMFLQDLHTKLFPVCKTRQRGERNVSVSAHTFFQPFLYREHDFILRFE